MKNNKKQLRENWQLGFLSILSLIGLRYFETGEYLYLFYFLWIFWLGWFIPVTKEEVNNNKEENE